MGSSKPKPVQAPFQQQQQNTNTFEYRSPYGQQGVQEYLDAPLDFGGSYGGLKTDVDIDPGVGRRTDLASQAAENRANSAFNFGVPRFIREANAAKEQRDIRSQGAAEAQQAEYGRQTAQRGLEFQKAGLIEDANREKQFAELERRRMLLPQILQTGGSGSSSGYNTVVTQPQPGFWQRAALGAIGGASSALRFGG